MNIDESLGSMDLKKIASFLRTRQESAEYLEKVAKDKNIYIRVSYSGFVRFPSILSSPAVRSRVLMATYKNSRR